MCTVTLAWQVFPDAPVVVAANRDEQFERPAEPPALRDWEVRTVAPRDESEGGTWLGYNEHGVLVLITNRWLDDDIETDRSRGLLVRDALAHESAEAASRYVEREVDSRRYDGFNLLAVDDSAAILLEWRGTLRVRQFEPGVHVVVNVGADGDYEIPSGRQEFAESQAANANDILTTLAPHPGEESEAWLDRAASVIADHEYGVCIHDDGFGTRSSSLIHMTLEGVSYRFADGPPCHTEHERVDAVL